MHAQGNEKACQEDGCEKPAHSRGMCRNHYGKWWYQQNRESRNATNRKYYERNREEVLARTNALHRQRRATPEGREAEREANRRRYYENLDKSRERAREWYRANREKAGPRAKISMRKAKAARHGLTLEEMEAILARGCAICGADSDAYLRSLHLDHDHASGKVRDALCHGCNTGLGAFKDDPARLRTAADYIDQHKGGDAK